MLKTLRPEDVRMGMYIESFEGNWLSHPFWRSRFLIVSRDELERVRNGGVAVVVDTARSQTSRIDEVAPRASRVPTADRVGPLNQRRAQPTAAPSRPGVPLRRVVAPASFGKADKVRAVALAERSISVVKSLFEDSRLGRTMPVTEILGVVRDIAATLEQNSAAFASVTRLRATDDITYTHSIAVCALMIGLGRESGLSPAAVQDLGVAGLLHDIGKTFIDEAILLKVDDLDEGERAELLRHPQAGHELLLAEPCLPAVALDVCLHHHERIDGSGYPFGLRGDEIGHAARMAAICDVYDAMRSERPYKKGMLPVEAITYLEASPDQFDQTILFKLMRSIGVFPVGKLVRLRSNRLAVVLPTRKENSLPVCRAFYATVGNHFIDYEDVVLSDGLNNEQAISDEAPAVWFTGDWEAMSARVLQNKPLNVERQ